MRIKNDIEKWLKWGLEKKKGTAKEEILKCLDLARIRLATKNKIAQKKHWNFTWFKEWLDKEKLISKYQEWSIRGGKKIGNKFLSFLDIDIEKSSLEEWRKRQLRKNVRGLLNHLGCCYVETKKGFHIYILSDELLTNEVLYHVDSWLKRQKIIGSIQSKGKYVVGFDSMDKKLVENGKWFWHVKDLAEVKKKLGKFFIEIGKRVARASKVVKNTCRVLKQRQFSIQAKILTTGRKFLNSLGETMRKIRYLNLVGKSGYFLLNTYQRPNVLEKMFSGKILSLGLVQGSKHSFFNRMI